MGAEKSKNAQEFRQENQVENLTEKIKIQAKFEQQKKLKNQYINIVKRTSVRPFVRAQESNWII